MDNQQEKAIRDLGWLAGIVDGEGHITLARQTAKKTANGYYYRPMIAIGNTNPAIINNVIDIAKANNLPHYVLLKRVWKNKKWAVNFTYQIVGLKRCKNFLEGVRPHLVGKGFVSDVVLEYIKYREQRVKGQLNEHDDEFKELAGKANQVFNTKRAILRDHTPTSVEEAVKIWSDLQRELQSLVERSGRPQGS